MPDDPDWMAPMDYRILEFLHKTRVIIADGMWLKPKTITVNLDASRTYISGRLQALEAGGLIERDETGYCRITTDGSKIVAPDWNSENDNT